MAQTRSRCLLILGSSSAIAKSICPTGRKLGLRNTFVDTRIAAVDHLGEPMLKRGCEMTKNKVHGFFSIVMWNIIFWLIVMFITIYFDLR